MLKDLALALRLQAIDRKSASLEAEIAALPKHVAEIEKKLETHSRQLEKDRAALAANGKDRRQLEGEIQVHQQKISKLRDQSLQAKTNEQYKAFGNEITYAEGEIRKSEDRIIELMERSEALDKNVTASDIDLKKQSQHVEAEKKSARDRTAVDQKQLGDVTAERKLIVGQMDPSFYTTYERIRKKTKNTPISDATDGRCEACRISLRPQLFQDLRRGDQILQCESCGRILTYNPIVDVGSDLAASQQTA